MTATPPVPMTAADLSAKLDGLGVSTRELARRLDVSAMWVSRRRTGEVPLTVEDSTRILQALDGPPPF